MGRYVSYVRDGRLVRITLTRPEKLNAMNDDLVVELRGALERFDTDEDGWLAILSGEGRSFCAGADVQQRQLRPMEEMRRLGGPSGRGAAKVQHLLLNFVNWKPVIAAVQGYAVGGGLSLALQADLAVASTDAKFQITETGRGLNGRHLVDLMRIRGAYTLAMEAALTARYFSADEAFQHHLINRVVPEGQHLAAAEELAETVLGNPPLAVRAQVRARRWDHYRLAVETETVEDPGLHLTEDYQEAVRSFVERRKPVYHAK